jgi:hypothetical protein
MARTKFAWSFGVGLGLGLAGSAAFAHGDDPQERGATETAAPEASTATPTPAPVVPAKPAEEKKKPLPWHGSTLLFDQSVTSQTIGVGKSYQSYNPTYEWWLALKLKYFLFENETHNLAINLWSNLYYELTNSDSTTTLHEPWIGPTWLWATYGRTLYSQNGYKTTMSVGPRLTLPTDKAARRSGQILGVGAVAGVSQKIPIKGEDAPLWNSAQLGVTARYSHPFSLATTPVNGGLNNIVQDAAGHTVRSDQLSGGMNTANTADLIMASSIQVTPKLSYSLNYILMGSWGYRAPTGVIENVPTGPVTVATDPDSPRFRVNTWLVTSFDYDVLDEMSLSLGYYNLTNQIGPDGQRRNVLWSPDARFFFTVTGNLDAIYERFVPTDRSKTTVGQRAPAKVLAQ